MMETIGKAAVVLMLAAAAALTLWGCWQAERMMAQEREREALRRATAAAMRTDAHMARLRQQGRRVRYKVVG